MTTSTRRGVLLLNLGGPEKIEDVQPFLYKLFSDREIIRLGPWFMQKPLARLIARKRAPKSRANYQQIGGGSPLRRITEQQARALEQRLAEHGSYLVRPCMRYWHPYAAEALRELQEARIDELIALPLYPHYSRATTGSSLSDLESAARKLGLIIPLHTIDSWPQQNNYISSLVERIREGLAAFGDDEVQIVYSAHSLPVSLIREGDPYVEHLQQTIDAIERQTGRPGRLCYQSRSGPVEWLGPSTPETIESLSASGCRKLLMVPISFVSDHVETLYELNIQYRKLAETAGLEYRVTAGLNTSAQFIEGLCRLVLQAG
ncbi:ferrochelatase [Desulfogranum mediterraneum]|uniref:ferrochelatase n=1 Tax=Desulfogranum mediterraneum TaxID=160661 RepID=UPI00048D42C3|nr:ferrochelatase [Desulfogranum mediterraneum]